MPASLSTIGHIALASLVVLHPLDINFPVSLDSDPLPELRRVVHLGWARPGAPPDRDRVSPDVAPFMGHRLRGSLGERATPNASGGGQNCGGRCLNPHPGNFRTWNGQQNGCWLTVWRQWPEGCTHHQGFNTCTRTWDVDQHGNPRVYWTCCVH
jgi:hypothetical protein